MNDGFVDDERRDTLAETQAREDMRVLQRVVDSVTSDEGDTDSDSDDEGPNFKEVIHSFIYCLRNQVISYNALNFVIPQDSI